MICARLCAAALLLLISSLSISNSVTQEREDRTLLDWTQMRAIINEVSGERPMHTVQELVPYPRVRTRAEYEGRFRETEVMEGRAREYGFQNVEVESFPGGQPSWLAHQGELWMTEPELRKLYDINDIVIAACPGSDSGDATASLVDVGTGARPEDYTGRDVAGKIVLGSAGANVLQRQAVFERGAIGVLSYNSMRPDSYPDEVLSQSIAAQGPQGKAPGFGWAISPRLGRELAQRLAQGAKINLRSLIKAETFPGEMELVHATIPGDGSSDQAVMVSGHLYEGYTKQGANDDNSGCAATLEMGRAFLRLVKDGKLSAPKRTIHFLWLPEISGTMAWLNKHQDVRKQLIADLNFDMEGLGLRQGLSAWVMHRTPDTLPSFLNDLCASFMEFIGNLNRERLRYRHNGYAFTLPVTAPNGSLDPFYYFVEKHYGASDHAIYINQGIPAVIFSTWPDMYYHSSQDTPDKLDSTQFKRASVVGAAAMTVLATADDAGASKVAAEVLARGTERLGEAQRKGLSYIADADASALAAGYRDARNAVRHQAEVEKAALRSSAVLFSDKGEAEKRLSGLIKLVDQKAVALDAEVRGYYEFHAQAPAISTEPTVSDDGKLASKLVVERVGAGGMGGFGGRFGGQSAMEKFPPEERPQIQSAMRKIPQHMTGELNVLLGQKKTVQEIRDFISGEFEPIPLADVLEYLRAMEKLGSIKLRQ
jgi:aminopeptidase YwaD